jgi:hypothetical protein
MPSRRQRERALRKYSAFAKGEDFRNDRRIYDALKKKSGAPRAKPVAPD